MARFVALMGAGIAQGCITGLIALGIVLLYKATGVVNFAQGASLSHISHGMRVDPAVPIT
jgi:branched-subunit amino acid ABC-type transport system permease component